MLKNLTLENLDLYWRLLLLVNRLVIGRQNTWESGPVLSIKQVTQYPNTDDNVTLMAMI